MAQRREKKLDKPSLTDEALHSNGIFVESNVYDPDNQFERRSLPKPVRELRRSLLTFTHTIHPDFKGRFDSPDAQRPADSFYLDLEQEAIDRHSRQYNSARVHRARDNTEDSINIADEFRGLAKAKSAEPEWTHPLVERIFQYCKRTNLSSE